MIRGIYTSASGMNVFEIKQQILTNNLANLDTAGFKSDLMRSEISLKQEISRFTASPSTIPIVETLQPPRSLLPNTRQISARERL